MHKPASRCELPVRSNLIRHQAKQCRTHQRSAASQCIDRGVDASMRRCMLLGDGPLDRCKPHMSRFAWTTFHASADRGPCHFSSATPKREYRCCIGKVDTDSGGQGYAVSSIVSQRNVGSRRGFRAKPRKTLRRQNRSSSRRDQVLHEI